MKTAAVLVILSLAGITFAAHAETPVATNGVGLEELQAIKEAGTMGVPDPQGLVGGEDIPNALPIGDLPFSDTGNTCGFLDDYEEACPFLGFAPDVVYSYSPDSDGEIDIDLCSSGYDTKVFVYENDEFTPVACDDDACGVDGFRSRLGGVEVMAGNTYFIVVDGFDDDCGVYEMHVTRRAPFRCPQGAFLEGEPDCFDDYDDVFNGGCNSTPNVFSSIPCAQSTITICGTYGGFFDNQSGFNFRDTDWYELDPGASNGNVEWCVLGKYKTLIGYADATQGCDDPVFLDFQVLDEREEGCLLLPPGNHWLFVATTDFGVGAGACGGLYVMTVAGQDCLPISVNPTSWARIKSAFQDE